MTNEIEFAYAKRRKTCLVKIAAELEQLLLKTLDHYPRIDRISARAKSISSFVRKANKKTDGGLPKYTEPLDQITDQIGARIITFYERDVESLSSEMIEYFRPIEKKEMKPKSDMEFGYFGRHFLMPIPSDVIEKDFLSEAPEHFELQVKTMFQHAWSENNHDLDYKPGFGDLDSGQRRLVGLAAAQSWGADKAFSEVAGTRVFVSKAKTD